MAPFAPHIAEEIWHLIGFKNSVHLEHWPSFNAEALKENSYELVLQVNGKVRDKININNEMNEDQIKELTLKRPNILKWTKDKEIRKIIIVKGKIINIHPSLLPRYKGLNTFKRALKNKDKFTGCTVHYVDEKLDNGRIIIKCAK